MIIRRKTNAKYTLIPNDPIHDEKLSFECLGLLTYLLSRPNDWTVNLKQLRSRGSLGREKMQQLVRELIDHGYAVRRRARVPNSQQFGPHEYVIYDHPRRPMSQRRKSRLWRQMREPQTAKPATANPSLY